MPDRHQRLEALVLKTYPIAERHRGLIVLTPDQGILSLIAHGTEGSKSRWRGLLSPLRRLSLAAYHDPVAGSWKVEDVDEVRPNEGLSRDPERFFAASRWSEILLKSHGGIEGAFELFDEALALACWVSGPSLTNLEAQFLWRLADLAGLRPDFLSCDGCGRPLFGIMVEFLPDPATALCLACGGRSGWILEPRDLDYLTATAVFSLSESLLAPLDPARGAFLQRLGLLVWKTALGGRLLTIL